MHGIRYRNIEAFNKDKQMRKVIQLIIVANCMALLAGCASTTQYVPLPDQSKRIEDSNKARISVVRPTSFGRAVSLKVRDGDRLIGNIGPNKYLCWEHPVGQMELIGKAEGKSKLNGYKPPQELTASRLIAEITEPEREKHEAKPEDPEAEKPKPEEPKPIEVSPSPYRLLRRNAYYIAPELYSFKYKEPGYMEEEGMFYGAAFGYTYRGWVPGSPEQSFASNKMMARAEGRVAFGRVDYDGALTDGTPFTINGIDDFVLEGRLLLGPEWLGENTLNTLYAGMGYRYLKDDTSFNPSGYERESNYYYVPIGFEIDTNFKAGWSWAGRIEFDYLLRGIQKSHLNDFDPELPDIENDQDSGYGYRASIKLLYKSTDVIFAIEPFFRYWDIDKSEVSYGWIEPANETTEYGIQLTWMF